MSSESTTAKPTVRIENWSLVSWQGGYGDHNFVLDGLGKFLTGEVQDHPRFKQGKRVWTSTIVNDTNIGEIETLNTTYVLGQMDPAYSAWMTGESKSA